MSGSTTIDAAAVTGTALKLDLDEAAAEAFARTSAALPGLALETSELAKDLGELADDLILVPAVKAADQAGSLSGIDTVQGDLTVIASQIKDAAVKARLTRVINRLKGIHGKKPTAKDDDDEEELEKFQCRILAKFDLNKEVDAEIDISKDERTVLGIVLEPEVIDSQNDVESAAEIKKTAHRFMERYQQFGLMHKKIVPSVLPLESYLAPVDFEIDGQKVKKGSWLVRVRVLDDAIWKDVRSGKLTGFSIGGSAMRKPEKATA